MKGVLTTGGTRVHRGYDGREHVVSDRTPSPYIGAFRCALAGSLQVRVGLGTVEGYTPKLNDVPLDGVVGKSTVPVPLLELEDGPNQDLRSWILLRFRVDLETGLPDPEDEDLATIIHGNDLRAVFSNGVSPDDGEGHGHCPLAMIVWRDKETVQRIVQNTYFQLRHSFIPAASGRRAFHLFTPAA